MYPAAPIAPRGSYQTVTAIVTGVNNKTVTWTASGGTLVGTNPCVVNEPCTIALTTTTAGTYTLTATSNANHAVTATSTVTFTASPTPATTHPRLLVTAGMLSALQAKTTGGNTLYQAMLSRYGSEYTTDAGIWTFSTWNGSACVGGSGPSSDQSQSYKEQDAYDFAFMSMIDPSDPTYQWGCAGHDIMTYMMAAVISNPAAYMGNHSADSVRAFTLTPDWLMAGGYLSSADLTQTRTYFAAFADAIVNMSYGTIAPIGNYNGPLQFDTGSEWDYTNQRAMGNNYTQSKMLYLAASALTFNDNTTDDPPLVNTCSATRYQVCPDGTAGSLHAYWTFFTGGMMYKDWANIEDPNVTWQAYQAAYGNLPTQPSCDSTWYALGTKTPCFGLGRGGEANEGSSYGGSLSALKLALDSATTAGYLDPMLYGPQMSLASSSYFDLRVISDLATLTGVVPNNSTSYAAGANPGSYNFLNTGDELDYYKYPSNYTPQTAMLLANSYTGRTEGNSAMLWTILNTAFGGPLGTEYPCRNYCGFTGELTNDFARDVALDLFIALPAGDPTSSLPADPRPSLPTDLYDAGNQHITIRNNWTSSGTLFSYYSPNTAIDHEHEFVGRFDVFANGEYITKGRVEFNDYNNLMTTAPQQNLVAYQNNPSGTCTDANGCFEGDAAQNGGQWWHAEQGGLVTLLHSELPTYVAAIVDQSNAYNTSAYADFPSYASGISASRSLIYLRGSNQVVYYDRGNSGSNAWTKQLYQITTGNPTISGNVASWLTRSSTQKAYFTSLLPAGATLANAGLTPGTGTNQAPDWEPYASLEVNAGSPASTQFLTVLEWGASSLTQSTTTLVSSSAGQTFDGALIGSSLVMFMRTWPANFTSVTYPASGATTQYVSDLTPNTTYTISGAGVPASGTTDTAGVLMFAAAGTGNVTVGSGSSAPIVVNIAVTPATVVLQALASQQYAATCTYSDGSSADCTSESTWSSSPRGVVTIDSSGMATGVAQGSANIIATSGSIQGQAAITVPVATLQTITVTPGPLAVPVGGTQQFKATGIYSNSSTTDMTSLVNWSSSNTAVASPNSTGFASMMSQGSANIIAASGNVRGQVSVTVSVPTTPSFSPAAGTYTSPQTVTIGTSTPSATIYYTTNGSTPTTGSVVYSGPITVASTETVQAIAVASGYSTSAVASASYAISLPAAVTPTFSPAGGTYTSAQSVTIGTTTPSATIYYTTNGSTPTTSSAVYAGSIAVSSTETIKAIAVATGYTTSVVGSAAYTINLPAAATPTFSPAGGSYTSAQSVTIGTTTPSATIYYTTNGSTPTTNSAVYAGAIAVSSTETINAIAVASGYSTSAVVSASFTIGQLAASPSFSVGVTPASLTITAGTSGTTTVLVTPQNGFAAETSLTCSALPSWASCTFSPSTVTPSGSIASSTLTITTTPMQEASRSGTSALFPGSALAISLCCFGWRKRRGLQMLVLAVAILGVGLCTGCGANTTSPVQATVSIIAVHGDQAPTTSLTLTLM
jgi:hypothetical protein